MKIYTVTEFNQEMNTMLAEMPVTIQGEVSGFHINQSRFVFFALKDEKSSVGCFLMLFHLKVKIQDGMEIRVSGTPNIFIKSGNFNINVKNIELIGDGLLQKRYEQLKKKLAAEGLFDDGRKRPLPRFPETIGLVTSEDAAAFTDILRIINIRWPITKVILHSVPVQGPTAASLIVLGVNRFSERKNVDVVIIARGGGSMEDLQAFNSEEVARAVFACQIPVVSGIGHERDVTLVDFVADQRAATPTHAAELVVPHQHDVIQTIDHSIQSQYKNILNILSQINFNIHDHLQTLNHVLRDQMQKVGDITHHFLLNSERWMHNMQLMLERLENQTLSMKDAAISYLDKLFQKVNHQERLLISLHPLKILKRGYSVTYLKNTGVILRKKHQLKKDDIMVTRLQDGSVESKTIL